MSNKIDLHIHTTASDGRMSPLQIVCHAEEQGLTYIAITDHDSINGLLSLEKENLFAFSVNVIPGIEFSTDLPDNEVHILGYGIDIHNQELSKQLEILTQDRRQRAQKMVNKLVDLGYHIEFKEVIRVAGNEASVGRPHIAKALIDKGYFSTTSEVFTKVLGKHGPAYVPHFKLAPDFVVQLIKQAGGIPVLAHPGLIGDDRLVLELLAMGIEGIEVYHPSHEELQIKQYLAIARKRNLIVTGGSDFHASPDRYPEKLGIFPIPLQIIDGLIVAGQA